MLTASRLSRWSFDRTGDACEYLFSCVVGALIDSPRCRTSSEFCWLLHAGPGGCTLVPGPCTRIALPLGPGGPPLAALRPGAWAGGLCGTLHVTACPCPCPCVHRQCCICTPPVQYTYCNYYQCVVGSESQRPTCRRPHRRPPRPLCPPPRLAGPAASPAGATPAAAGGGSRGEHAARRRSLQL